jgi:hypothetical protein
MPLFVYKTAIVTHRADPVKGRRDEARSFTSCPSSREDAWQPFGRPDAADLHTRQPGRIPRDPSGAALFRHGYPRSFLWHSDQRRPTPDRVALASRPGQADILHLRRSGGHLCHILTARRAARRCWPEPTDSPAGHVPSVATIITRERSGSFTAGSRGRTKPFSTTPATARGRRR